MNQQIELGLDYSNKTSLFKYHKEVEIFIGLLSSIKSLNRELVIRMDNQEIIASLRFEIHEGKKIYVVDCELDCGDYRKVCSGCCLNKDESILYIKNILESVLRFVTGSLIGSIEEVGI